MPKFFKIVCYGLWVESFNILYNDTASKLNQPCRLQFFYRGFLPAFICTVQALFYEKLEPCPDEALPKFDGDLRVLEKQINRALTEANSYSRRSSADLPITLTVNNFTDFILCSQSK